ncbi:ABC transporter permease subunit [Bacillus sp. DTU_2020_1000418_1_SI_GHA_SEK_038]|uniref:ABC transporter permease n=1 Tax=Bacillus sp. DTU_2020_1000418_1_SI_GHA_SEK_038 TaxID=3077585 RepID=UPI0028E886C1|nr:ABC transporter permease subunit [Bacillus sp. DTU_2020_1000418_1_SI_GHA_SEK_038]WNS73577.1 ABC transporter permease subunit [Bacillus sp. DTU_2020_1000418_1_SI_GHA_SEK_038]
MMDILYSMVRHELRLLLRSKWLLNFMILFIFLSGLLYFYGLNSVKLDPVKVTYGLEGVNSNIETMGVNPEYYGLKEIKQQPADSENINQTAYNRSIALLINLSLWLLPIICLILGANSIIGDKESGRLGLYKTYQISYWKYMLSKFLSLVVSMFVVMGVSYGLFGLIFSIIGKSFQASIFQVFLSVNMLLIIVFSAASLFVGAISKTRMQGLSYALFFWCITVFIYEFVIMTVINWIPYAFKLNSLFFFILLNPIESIRVWSISKLNAEYVFGPEFLIIEQWSESGMLSISLMISIVLLMWIAMVISTKMLKKRGV